MSELLVAGYHSRMARRARRRASRAQARRRMSRPPSPSGRPLRAAAAARPRRTGVGAGLAALLAGAGRARRAFWCSALFDLLPQLAGLAACRALWSLFGAAFAAALWLRRSARPACPIADAARRRIEQASGLAAPAAARARRSAERRRSIRAAAALWQAHRARMAARGAPAARRLAAAGLAAPRPLGAARRRWRSCCCSARSMPASDWRERLVRAVDAELRRRPPAPPRPASTSG